MTRNRLLQAALLSIGALSLPCCSGDAPVSDQPDGFILATKTALVEGKPASVWNAMPASYQSDIGGVVHEFAGNMDEDVWNKGFSVARKLVEVVDKKRDLILAQPMLAPFTMGIDTGDEFQQQLDRAVAALGTLLESEIRTLDGLQKLDLDSFVEDTLSEVFAPLMEMAEVSGNGPPDQWLKGKMMTTITEQTETSATVKVEVEGESTEEVKVVKVDGVWIPEEMARDWAKGLAEVRGQLAGFKIEAAQKAEILAGIAVAESILDQLLAAKTTEEFSAAVTQAMMMASKMGG